MPGEIFVIGLNWRSAPVSVRERLAFHDEELEASLLALCELPFIEEALILSTCNRVEIYACTSKSASVSSVSKAAAETRSFLSRTRNFSTEELAGFLYEKTEKNAVQHIFEVASALDSLVVGESQILGQLKSAYGTAVNAGTMGTILGRCIERAFGVAKRVRTETGISRGAANVASVAVELAKRVFGDLHGKSVLVVGAGKMSALAARHLRADGAAQICVTNRSMDKAVALAGEIDGIARSWDELELEIAKSDVIVSSTGARQPVLTKKLLKMAMKRRRYKPCVIMDIAVPRDVETSAGKLEGVYLFNIDDLERLVSDNLKERGREAVAAVSLVEFEVDAFQGWLRQQHIIPTIRALREHFHRVAAEEAMKSLKGMSQNSKNKDQEEVVLRLAKSIANKLLHTPMSALKNAVSPEDLSNSTKQLFSLTEEHEESPSVSQTSTNASMTTKKA